MQSVMNHNFSQSPNADIPRSAFNRSHGYKTTMNADYLIPFFIDEALPGDTFNLKATIFSRAMPLVVPFMDNMYCETFFFAVPYRLVWENWQRFNGEQDEPGDSTDFLVPQVPNPTGGWDYQSLGDYMGLPTKITNINVSSLFFRAYNLIWNEWFRDENLQDRVPVPKGDGPDDPGDYSIMKRNKRRDYFTSGLPWPQKGPSIQIPLGSAPVTGIGKFNSTFATGPVTSRESTGTTANYATYQNVGDASGDTRFYIQQGNTGFPNIRAQLDEMTEGTINALRQAFQLQKLYERDARGGTRYTEVIKAHFGVTSPDARLQRPEYLGGGSTPLNINAVAQTSSTDAETPQANLAATGTLSASGHGFTKSFTEHTILIGLVNLRADITYQQGINRMWSRRTRWDFYWPALSHIGEQSILNKEIYAQGIPEDDEAFAYQERFAEYRYKPSQICGKLRSIDPGTLDVWHLSQFFTSKPVLGDTFIRSTTPLDRSLAIPSEPAFILDAFFDMKCARPMPTYSVPGLVDHF